MVDPGTHYTQGTPMRPLFILGSGRCGSTYLRELLQAHPRIAMTNEAGVASFLATAVAYSRVSREEAFHQGQGLIHADVVPDFSTMFRAKVRSIAEEFYSASFGDQDIACWGDKIGFDWLDSYEHLQTVFPDPKFVVMIRDFRDVLVSWRAWATRLGLLDHLSLTWPVGEICNFWNRHYTKALEVLDDHLVIRYESLVPAPKKCLQDILGFVNLAMCPQIEAALHDNETFRQMGTSSSVSASLGRWKHELPRADARIVEETCGPLMRRFGYPVAAATRPESADARHSGM